MILITDGAVLRIRESLKSDKSIKMHITVTEMVKCLKKLHKKSWNETSLSVDIHCIPRDHILEEDQKSLIVKVVFFEGGIEFEHKDLMWRENITNDESWVSKYRDG